MKDFIMEQGRKQEGKQENSRFIPIWENIPEHLKCLTHWVVWLKVPDSRRNDETVIVEAITSGANWEKLLPVGEKITKPPIDPKIVTSASITDPKSVAFASITDPAQWSDLETAKQAFLDNLWLGGIGFVFTKSLGMVAIDFDDCIDGAGNWLWGKEDVDNFDSFAEVSPSGKGLHILATGKKTRSFCKKGVEVNGHKGAIEIYNTARYFTVTGKILPGKPKEIRPATEAQIENLYRKYWGEEKKISTGGERTATVKPSSPVSIGDSELIEKAKSNPTTGAAFSALWDGDFGKDHSKADFELCQLLAFWTRKDAAAIDRLFGQSELSKRAKWEKRPDYRQSTIARAIAATSKVYQPEEYRERARKEHEEKRLAERAKQEQEFNEQAEAENRENQAKNDLETPEEKELAEAIAEADKVLETENIKRAVAAIAERVKPDVAQAFAYAIASQCKAELIIAATGAGKSTESARIISETLKAGEAVLYSGDQKSDMGQMHDAYLMPLLTSEEKQLVQKISLDDGADIDDSTLAVITHKTYLTRKGFSTLHYKALLWLAEMEKKGYRVTVIIDEASHYIEAQKLIIAAGTRYRKRICNGALNCEVVSRCMLASGCGNCANCQETNQVIWHAPKYGLPAISPYIDGRTGSDLAPCFFPVCESKKLGIFRGVEITELSPEGTTQIREYLSEYPKTEAKTRDELRALQAERFAEAFNDMLKEAFRPKLYRLFPRDKQTGQEIPLSQIRQQISDKKQQTGKNKNERLTDSIITPKLPCNVYMYGLWDTSSSAYIYQHTDKVIFLNPDDLDGEQETFLQTCCPRIEKIKAVDAKIKIDELAILEFRKELDFFKGKGELPVIEPLLKLIGDKVAIIFCPTIEEAKKLYRAFPRGYPVSRLAGDENDLPTKVRGKDVRVYITHSFGPFGHGVNMPEVFITFIDAEIRLPLIAYRPNAEITEESVNEGYKLKCESQANNNGGRQMRGTEGRKITIIHNTGDIQPRLDKLAANWQPKVKTTIKTLVIEESQEYLLDAAAAYLATGELLTQEEKDYQAEHLAEKKENEMTKTERAFLARGKADYEQKRDAYKQVERYKDLLSRAKELKKSERTWGEIKRILHLDRGNLKQYETRLKSELETKT